MSPAETKRRAGSVNPEDSPLAVALRNARRAAGLTQEAAAVKLRVNRATIIKWESGKSVPQDESALRIGAVYGIDSSTLPGFGHLGRVVHAPGHTPYLTRNIFSGRVTAWKHRMLAELAEGGATREELAEAELLVDSFPVRTRAWDATGGPDGSGDDDGVNTDDEILATLQAVEQHIIRPKLRRRGRRV